LIKFPIQTEREKEIFKIKLFGENYDNKLHNVPLMMRHCASDDIPSWVLLCHIRESERKRAITHDEDHPVTKQKLAKQQGIKTR
jgi:hypothetical protein